MPEPRILIPPGLSPRAFAEREAGGIVHLLSGGTMGTRWSAKLVAADGVLPGLHAAIQATLDAVVAEMSTWEAASDISRFNCAPAGRWQALPPAFFHVLAAATDVAAASDGAFDPTAGALVELWGFGPAPTRLAPPSDAEIVAARARSGWRRLELDRPARRARQPGGLSIDLSGIAKGYAVDAVAETLRIRGVRHALVEVGGELRGEGLRPDGQPWWVDIETPPGLTAEPGRVALHGLSVATSGDYRRYFDHGTRRYAHSIDPRTGYPVDDGLASVTVLHPNCMLADAWATALTVLGPDEGLALAEAQALAATFVLRHGGGEERSTRAFLAMLD